MANLQFPNATAQKVANIWATDHGAAEEGSFYVATNPTVGTAIATTTSVVDDAATASATHAQNVPVMLVENGWGATDPLAKNVYLKYLRMMLVQVPTSATSWRFAMRLDNSVRYTSGGSLIVPVNLNSNYSTVSSTRVRFGAVVTALPGPNARLVSNGLINSVVPVTLDQWLFTFGNPAGSMDQISGGSGAKNLVVVCPPVIIGPGWNLALEMWGASNAAAPTWEFELGFVERASQ